MSWAVAKTSKVFFSNFLVYVLNNNHLIKILYFLQWGNAV